MAASFPGAIKAFVDRIDNIDTVMAADVNDAYAEIMAVETALGTNPKGTSASVKEKIASFKSAAGATADVVTVTADNMVIAGATDLPLTARTSNDTDELTVIRLDKRNAAGANAKRWDLMIDDATGDFRIRPGDGNYFFKVSNGAKTLDSLLVDTSAGKVYVNDNANGDMGTGLTINQGANDDHIISLKSSDVAHGVTTLCETDTFGFIRKEAAASGGLYVSGITETNIGISLNGVVTTEDATRSTAGIGAIMLSSYLKSGTTTAAMSADKNIVAFRTGTTTRFILDSDGDSHQDVGAAWTNFDTHDDAELLTALSVEVSRADDPIRKEFGEFLSYNRQALEDAKLVTFNENGHHFVNMSKLTMLLTGAVRQLSSRLEKAEALLEEHNLKLLEA